MELTALGWGNGTGGDDHISDCLARDGIMTECGHGKPDSGRGENLAGIENQVTRHHQISITSD